VDDCLKVVAAESKRGRNVTGTRISIIDGEVVASWKIHGSGVRRETLMRRNGVDEQLIKAARNAYVYGDMNRKQVIAYLMLSYGASREDAVLASAAGKVLAREVGP
jgi:hypothetical protein